MRRKSVGLWHGETRPAEQVLPTAPPRQHSVAARANAEPSGKPPDPGRFWEHTPGSPYRLLPTKSVWICRQDWLKVGEWALGVKFAGWAHMDPTTGGGPHASFTLDAPPVQHCVAAVTRWVDAGALVSPKILPLHPTTGICVDNGMRDVSRLSSPLCIPKHSTLQEYLAQKILERERERESDQGSNKRKMGAGHCTSQKEGVPQT